MLGVAEAVEDLQLRARKRQLAVLVLTVEREQRARRRRAALRRRRAAVQIGARASVGADAPREHELLGVGGSTRSPSCSRSDVGQIEDPLDIGLAGAGADDPGPRAAAEQQVERVREHGLARAGLAGEHVQPRRQAQLRLARSAADSRHAALAAPHVVYQCAGTDRKGAHRARTSGPRWPCQRACSACPDARRRA